MKPRIFSVDQVQPLILHALKEDMATHDVTTRLFNRSGARICHGRLMANSTGVVAGLVLIIPIFDNCQQLLSKVRYNKVVKPRVKFYVNDGDVVRPTQRIAEITAPVGMLLSTERTILNFVQHLSGIATLTRKYVDTVCNVNPKVKIYDTRKTTPGMRYLEKYAVICGGGNNHRFNLADQVLIKDNHWELIHKLDLEKLKNRIEKLKKGRKVKVEIELQKVSEIDKVLHLNPDIIMLDNMNIYNMKAAIKKIRSFSNKIEIEVSGNVSFENIKPIAKLDIDRISVGKITHSAPAADISLEIVSK